MEQQVLEQIKKMQNAEIVQYECFEGSFKEVHKLYDIWILFECSLYGGNMHYVGTFKDSNKLVEKSDLLL